MPVAVGIGLTNECNLACPHCYRPTLTQQRLTLGQVETILDNLEVGSVNLGVGENGVHPEYREMLGFFHEREVKTAITSNGFSLAMLTDEELAGFHSIELSFDFPTKEEMDEFRGEGAWEMAIGSLERCQHLGIPTSVAAVMMSTNYDRMEEVARFAFGLGCDLRVNVYQPVTGEEFTLSYDEFWQGFADLFAAGPVVVCSEPLVNAVMGLETTRGNPCGQTEHPGASCWHDLALPLLAGRGRKYPHLADPQRNIWDHASSRSPGNCRRRASRAGLPRAAPEAARAAGRFETSWTSRTSTARWCAAGEKKSAEYERCSTTLLPTPRTCPRPATPARR